MKNMSVRLPGPISTNIPVLMKIFEIYTLHIFKTCSRILPEGLFKYGLGVNSTVYRIFGHL